jgi:hypothetical protein
VSAEKPRTLADSLGLVGQALLVSWGLLTYYLVTQWRVVYDPRNSQVYAAALLLWLALSLPGIGRIAFALIRPARERRPQVPVAQHTAYRPSAASTSWFVTPDHEDHHDDHDNRLDDERNDSTHAPR